MRLLTIILCTLAGCVSCVGEKGGDGVINHVNVGDKVPAFTVDPPEGAEWTGFTSPEDFGGRKSLLVLFDPTCGQCKIVLPIIETVWKELIRDNRDEYCLVNISRQRTEESAELWETKGFEMPYHLDPDRSVFELFANSTVPRIYLIDTDGIVRDMLVEKYDFTAKWLMDELQRLQ